jgi:hypothetical protein
MFIIIAYLVQAMTLLDVAPACFPFPYNTITTAVTRIYPRVRKLDTAGIVQWGVIYAVGCYVVIWYCNSYRLLWWGFYSRWAFITHKYSTLQLRSITYHNKHYLNGNCCLAAASLFMYFTADSLNMSVLGLLQLTTHDRTLHRSISFPANNEPQDHTAQRSAFLASPDPTALDVQHSQSPSINYLHTHQITAS